VDGDVQTALEETKMLPAPATDSMACASPFNQRVAAEPMIIVLFTSGPYFPFFPVFVRHSPRSLEAPTPFACLTSVANSQPSRSLVVASC
jgi:hypothetical protein